MTPRTKMVIMNSPGNPSGSVYSREELEAIVEVAAEEDIYILSDEIYEKLVYDDAKHVSIASLSKEAYDLTITVNGFSKSYAMTGWRLGYMGAPKRSPRRSIRSRVTAPRIPAPSRKKARSLRSRATSNRSPTCATNSICGATTCTTASQRFANITAVKPLGAFYVLVNISQLGLNSQNFCRSSAQQSQRRGHSGRGFRRRSHHSL